MTVITGGFLASFLNLLGISVTNPDYLLIFSILTSLLLVVLVALFLGFLFKFFVWLRR